MLSQKEIWAETLELPDVQRLIETGWHFWLPCPVFVAFVGVAEIQGWGIAGQLVWDYLEALCSGAFRANLSSEQQRVADLIEERFVGFYGPFKKTVKGAVKCLIDLGLVVRGKRGGEKILYVPDTLPPPADILLSDDKEMPVTIFRAKPRGIDGVVNSKKGMGDRHRVFGDQLPQVRKMLELGWARHLPLEIGAMFLVVATVTCTGCKGKLMWGNIRDLYSQAKRAGPPYMPPPLRKTVAQRFAAEYGKPHATSVKGAVSILVDLGLVMQYRRQGQDVLEVPHDLPSPDACLRLSDYEKDFSRNEERRMFCLLSRARAKS